MKFSGYNSQLNYKTETAHSVVSSNPAVYGSGAGMEQAGKALGVAAEFAQKKQQESDEQDLLDARNKIMTSLTQQMYNSESGLFTTGYGENAKGLTGRVTDAVHNTVADVGKDYNGRVQQALRKTMKDNFDNFQRMAASRESAEAVKLKGTTIQANIDNGAQLCGLNYANREILDTQLKDGARLVNAYGMAMGLPGEAVAAKNREMVTNYVGAAIKQAFDANNMEVATNLLNDYKKDMDQKQWLQLNDAVSKKNDKLITYSQAQSIYDETGGDVQAARELAIQAATSESGSLDIDKLDKIMARVNMFAAEEKRAERQGRAAGRAARSEAVAQMDTTEAVEDYIEEHSDELDEGEAYQLRRQAENNIRICNSNRGGYKRKNAEADDNTLDTISLAMTQGNNISAASWVKASKAASRLLDSGYLPVEIEDEIADATGDENFYSMLTNSLNDYGYAKTREMLMDNGMSPEAATIVITQIDDSYKVTKTANLPDDEDEE